MKEKSKRFEIVTAPSAQELEDKLNKDKFGNYKVNKIEAIVHRDGSVTWYALLELVMAV